MSCVSNGGQKLCVISLVSLFKEHVISALQVCSTKWWSCKERVSLVLI